MSTELDPMPGVVEMIHGVPVADPYRWLEDRNCPATESWIAAQRGRFDQYIRQLGSLQALRQRVLGIVDCESIDEIGKVEDCYFYRRRLMGEQQPSIMVMKCSSDFERVLIDPSSRGPFASASIHRVSPDGGLLAFEVKHGGEHSKTIHIVDVNSGIVLSDHLDRGLARGFVFRIENDGFYYCHEPLGVETTPESNHVVRFHRLGSSSEDDISLLTLPRTLSSKLVLKSEGKMLGVIFCHDCAAGAVVDFYSSIQSQHDVWSLICQDVQAPFGPFFHRDRLFAHSFRVAPNGEIVELDCKTGRHLRVVVPEWHLPIAQCNIAREHLHVTYLIGTETLVRIWSIEGGYVGTLPLEEGHTWRLLTNYTNEVDELFLHCESFTNPPTLFRYQVHKRELALWSQRREPAPTAHVVPRKLAYLSKDGTEIAMSLVGLADISQVKDRPMIMTGYGGFGATMTPQFSAFVTVLLELGFLFAVPEIRGGGERGVSWHQEATGRNRQVAIDDFIAAAEWVCDRGFTNPQKLAIFGGSNSGILVGAAITQRPDLFRAALCIAPLLDMVRYHLFDRARAWTGEYGTAENPQDFHALLGYSPYHRVRYDTDYPAVLFVSGDQDTRCNPAHARKMAARLWNRPAQKHTVLIDYSSERGHTPNMPLSVRVDGITHRIAFLCHELGVSVPEEIKYATSGN